MLTDPFYNPAIEYSGTHVPVAEFDITAEGYAQAATRIKTLLQSAGWNIIDSAPSYVVQRRPAWYFLVSDLTLPDDPKPMTAKQCSPSSYLPWRGATIGDFTFSERHYILYDPRILTPTCPGGFGNTYPVAAGTTTWGSAQNLADAMNSISPWFVTVEDNGSTYDFTLTSKAAAFEYDESNILIGGTLNRSTRGYYELQSPMQPSGGILRVKIETDWVASGGYSFTYDADIGAIRVVMTVTAAGGGSYKQPIFPGSYYFFGSHHQFGIIPRNGQAASRLGNSSILATVLEPPAAHPGAGTVSIVIGSDNGSFTGNTDQLRKSLHWGINLACGHAFSMLSTGWHAGTGVQWYQLVTMLVRGTVGRNTVGRSGQPLVQSAYICVPANPQTGAEAVIVGKLKDMIIKSKISQIGAREMFDGKQWICISTSTESVDVYSSMWTLAA